MGLDMFVVVLAGARSRERRADVFFDDEGQELQCFLLVDMKNRVGSRF